MYESNEFDILVVQKISNLIIILLAAHLLHQTTSIEEIVTALYWLLRERDFFKKFIIRLVLVLDTVKVVQDIYTKTTKTEGFKKIGEQGINLFVQIFVYAETAPLRTLEISPLPPPPWKQWLYPLVIVILVVEEYVMQ